MYGTGEFVYSQEQDCDKRTFDYIGTNHGTILGNSGSTICIEIAYVSSFSVGSGLCLTM